MNPNPYQSPNECCESKATPFALGRKLGGGLIFALLFAIGGLVGLIGSIIRTLFSEKIIKLVLFYALLGLIAWPLWNYAAPAAFPYFQQISYFQAVALVLLTTILFKSAVQHQEEKISDDEKALLSILKAGNAVKRATPPGSNPAGDVTPRREAYRPQQSVPQPSGAKT